MSSEEPFRVLLSRLEESKHEVMRTPKRLFQKVRYVLRVALKRREQQWWKIHSLVNHLHLCHKGRQKNAQLTISWAVLFG